jgi:hypothetical protein
MYGVWKSMLQGRAADSLRFYGVVGITNAETKGIIVRAIETDDHYIQEWPGDVIYAGVEGNDEKFLALLGKCNCAVMPRSLMMWVESPTAQSLGYSKARILPLETLLTPFSAHPTQSGHGQTPHHRRPCLPL